MTIHKTISELDYWLRLEGIEGVAAGKLNEADCIEVLVSKTNMDQVLPDSFQGYPVILKFTGELDAQDDPDLQIDLL